MEVEYEHNGDGRALVKAEFMDYQRHENGGWALQLRINGESFTFTQDHLTEEKEVDAAVKAWGSVEVLPRCA